ncbi:MAG: hypothetical protein ACTSRS_08330 [Candidatus Helarchaeota archaeon]
MRSDPRNPDTDGDGLLDGADPDPLVPWWWTYVLIASVSARGVATVLILRSYMIKKKRQKKKIPAVKGVDVITIEYIEYKLNAAPIPENEKQVLVQNLITFNSLPTNEIDRLITTIIANSQFKAHFLANPKEAIRAFLKYE